MRKLELEEIKRANKIYNKYHNFVAGIEDEAEDTDGSTVYLPVVDHMKKIGYSFKYCDVEMINGEYTVEDAPRKLNMNVVERKVNDFVEKK